MLQFDLFQNFICQKVMPLVYDESLSYLEVLTKLSNYTNEMIKSVNDVISSYNNLSEHYNETLQKLNELQLEIEHMKNSFYIKDGSITLNKMSKDFLNKIQQFTVNTIHNIAKFVWFGLDDEGYFIAIIPESWNEIIFNTDSEGCLILEY